MILPIITSIKDYPEKLEDVLALHKVNSKTLGFLPEQAFTDAANENRILIALDTEAVLLGYILFATNKRSNFIYITHLCVSPEHRNNGIAKKLVLALVAKYDKKYRGIRVTCREDYIATKVWEKLNFTFSHEKPGRSKDGSILFVWWLNFHHTDLFTSNDSPKLKVVLDSNIAYDLMDSINSKTQNSFALLSDWLTEDVEYYITDQLKNDISHNKDKNIRKETINFVSNFRTLVSSHDNFFNIEKEIKDIYNKNLNSREESDIRHIAKTINSEASYFLTKDSGILKHYKIFYEKYALMVLSPEEFIIKFSSLINEVDYQPYRLAGTNIQKKVVTSEELKEIPSIFFNGSIEKKKEFEGKLNHSLITKHPVPYTVKSEREFLLFFTIFENEDIVEVEFIRHTKNLKNKTILNQIIHDLIYLAHEKKKNFIRISEYLIDIELESILMNFSFIKIDKIYYRFVSREQIEFNKISTYLTENIKNNALLYQYLKILSPYLEDVQFSYQIEKYLFPLKIINSEIHCFIIPIQSQWAANLFNSKLSEQDLFGGEAQLLFNKENAYYRAAIPLVLKNNSRILWYISKGNNKYSETMNISASSYLNELEIDFPKILFKKYERLGIYKWQDIIETAKNNVENKIMVFNFDLTENFNSPVTIGQLNDIFIKYLHKKFLFPQTPYKISEKLYFEIYNKGMGENL